MEYVMLSFHLANSFTLAARAAPLIRTIAACTLLATNLSAAADCAQDPNQPNCRPPQPRQSPQHPPRGAPHQESTSTNYGPHLGTDSMKKPPTFTAEKKQTIGPVSPESLHANGASASGVNQRSIIFVGGRPSGDKAALNTQPIPPGHANGGKEALNTQPIPPGHGTRPTPPPSQWKGKTNNGS